MGLKKIAKKVKKTVKKAVKVAAPIASVIPGPWQVPALAYCQWIRSIWCGRRF